MGQRFSRGLKGEKEEEKEGDKAKEAAAGEHAVPAPHAAAHGVAPADGAAAAAAGAAPEAVRTAAAPAASLPTEYEEVEVEVPVRVCREGGCVEGAPRQAAGVPGTSYPEGTVRPRLRVRWPHAPGTAAASAASGQHAAAAPGTTSPTPRHTQTNRRPTEKVKGVAEYAADARAFITAPATRKGLAFGAAAFLGATFAIALYRVYLKSQSVEAQRRRTVGRWQPLVAAAAAAGTAESVAAWTAAGAFEGNFHWTPTGLPFYPPFHPPPVPAPPLPCPPHAAPWRAG
jgi:hypothetical protein